MKTICTLLLGTLFALAPLCCFGTQPLDGMVVPDTTMIKLLCPPGKDIFTGSDGAISIPISKDKSLWLWGDAFMGEVIDKGRRDPAASPLIGGNLFVELDGVNAATLCGGTPQHPQPMIPSESVDGKKTVFWPHHGFVKNGILHIYMVRVVFDPEVWFYTHSVSYVRMRLPDYTLIERQELASYPLNGVWYGFGFFEQGGYYYTYGGTKSRELHVARGRLIDDKLQEWEYFDGAGWSSDPARTQKLEGVDVKISTQFSVFPHAGRYILITQDGEGFSNDIYSFVAETPTGPWGRGRLIYTAPEPSPGNQLVSYNAMAHPQYDKAGTLLVSYCVNSMRLQDIWEDVSIYRPRFIRVPYDLIFK